MKTIIVGGGISGLCTAWALAERGRNVIVLEQGALPNPLAASVDQHRMIRYPYGDSAGYCRLVKEAFAAWEKLWNAIGQSYYVETGILMLSCHPGDWSDRSRTTLDRVGMAYQLLTPEEMVQSYPFLSPAGVQWALFMPQGGVLLAERIVAALVNYLPTQGVEIRLESPVRHIDCSRRQVVLATGERLVADELVIAAGAWLPQLLPQYEARVTPERAIVVYCEPPPQLAQTWAKAPGIVDTGGEAEGYVLPPVAGTRLKFGAGALTRSGNPNDERISNTSEVHQMFDCFESRFVSLRDYQFIEARVCYYTMSHNQAFIVEEVGNRVWVISGCSGHGFKFGAAIGQRIAEMLVGKWTSQELTDWVSGEETVMSKSQVASRK